MKCSTIGRLDHTGVCTNDAITINHNGHLMCAECADMYNRLLLPVLQTVVALHPDEAAGLAKYTTPIVVPSNN
jgi:hypothetical protein